MKNIESEFVYPELVNQAFEAMKRMGLDVTRAEVFRTLLDNEMLNQDGTPTEKALREGLIEEVPSAPGPISDLKDRYPELRAISDDHFKVDPATGGVMIDGAAVLKIALEVLKDPKASRKDVETALQLIREVANN